MDLVIATNNCSKIKEFKGLLSLHNIMSLKDVDCDLDFGITSESLFENAKRKAIETYKATGMPVLADASGLRIKELELTLGSEMSDILANLSISQRNNYLVNSCKDLDGKASFDCVLVYFDGNEIKSSFSSIHGNISSEIKGDNKYGFYPIFEINDGKTLAQLSEEELFLISPRRGALAKISETLNFINVETSEKEMEKIKTLIRF